MKTQNRTIGVVMGAVTLAVIAVATYAGGAGSPASRSNAASSGPVALESTPSSATIESMSGSPRDYRHGRNVIEFKSIQEMPMSQMHVGLCRLLDAFSGPAGVFHVDSLVGVTEVGLSNPSANEAATYVELTLVDDWGSGSPSHVTARIGGGPVDKTTTALWRVSLQQGETVGLLLTAATPENRGYPSIHNMGAFKLGANGGASNGQLFTRSIRSLGEIGALVRSGRAAGHGACNDVPPDADTGLSPDPGPSKGAGIIVTPPVPSVPHPTAPSDRAPTSK